MRRWRRRAAASIAVVTSAATIVLGVSTGGASAQQTSPGVTSNSVKLGFVSPETGVVAPFFKGAPQACRAGINRANAAGGVSGRKIQLVTADDQSSANLTTVQDLVKNQGVFSVVDASPFATTAYRYLVDAGVPMIGGGADGT